MSSKTGEVITESFDYDGGRCVSVYVPRRAVEAIVFAGDGQLIASWGAEVERAGAPATMVVGVHRPADETERLREYSLGFDPERFTAHERFFTDQVPIWIAAAFGVSMPVKRTAVMGVSASGELAVALGLRHPELYGAILCASPGAGYRPPAELSPPIPHAYFVAGDQEPFFRDNAARWVHALRAAGTEVVATERRGTHGGPFWREEFPLMAKWAFGT
ncbi:alpha/beta hydrolase-fold protein [Gordonia asplenii]|uniref:alpha/beta hydrolase-fold protein n=1 Tax=Gordonia asplenii TaxID=2725283 RepID=UPI001FE6F168|nr:alpha/beta hydrolase-fold protein [Gordonia asplenii]